MMIPTTAIPMIAVVVKPPLPESVETVASTADGLEAYNVVILEFRHEL